jgi:hypothetical protein
MLCCRFSKGGAVPPFPAVAPISTHHPKRQETGALQDAARSPGVWCRAPASGSAAVLRCFFMADDSPAILRGMFNRTNDRSAVGDGRKMWWPSARTFRSGRGLVRFEPGTQGRNRGLFSMAMILGIARSITGWPWPVLAEVKSVIF